MAPAPKPAQSPDERLFELAPGRPYSERMQIIFGGALLTIGALILVISVVETEARVWGGVIATLGLILLLSGFACG